MEVRDGQWWEEGEEITPTLTDLSSPTHHHRQASWGHREPTQDPHAGVSAGQVDGDARVVTPLEASHRNKRIERRASLNEAANPGIVESGSLPLYNSVTGSSVKATHPPRSVRKANERILPQESHSSASEFGYDKGEKIVSSSMRDKDLEDPEHDLHPASVGWRGRRGTLSHDFEMRHVAAFRKSRHAPYSSSREAHVALKHQQRTREDSQHEKRQRLVQGNVGKVKVTALGRNISKPFEPSDALTRRQGRTSHTLLTITRSTQGKVKSNRTSTNSSQPHLAFMKVQSLSSGGEELMAETRRRQTPARGKEGAKLISNKNRPMSSSAKSRLVSPFTGGRVKRDVADMTYNYRHLEDIPTEASGCDEVMMLEFNSGGSDSGWRVHVVETVVTVVVKDINDNAPVFPDTTMLGHVQENGAEGE